MSDLIHKGKLFNALANAHDKGEIFAIIQNAKTIDAVPVVRCEDCVYRKADIMSDGISICTKFNTVHKDDFWCKGGERRTGE